MINYTFKNKNSIKYERHPFHLVDPSPWPILTAFSVFTLVFGFLLASNNLELFYSRVTTNFYPWHLMGLATILYSYAY